MSARGAAAALAALLALPAAAQVQGPDPLLEAGRINARLAMEYLKRDQLQVAREKVEKALQQNPKDVSVQLSAGVVYERLRDPDRAEKHFRQALRVDPESPEAQNAFGAFLCRNGHHEKGEEMFVKAALNQLYRTPVVAYTNAGVCARSDGNLERAEQFLRQALETRMEYPETYAQLAGVLHDRGSYLQARAFVQRFLAVAPVTADMLLLGYKIEVALDDRAAAAGFGERLRREFAGTEQVRALDDMERQNRG
jgi:type IV pilus assembly protein PilF